LLRLAERDARVIGAVDHDQGRDEAVDVVDRRDPL
jgi:hypothetical protein